MASYLIPEQIVGLPLFVPAANDFFSVDVGGMPNGENCLVMHGDVDRKYKAFMVPPVLSPNVFWSRTAIHSQVFWLKAPSTAPSSINAGEHVMMSVESCLQDQTNPTFGPAVWHIGAVSGGSGRITYKAGTASINIDGARTGGWHMITITNDGTNLHAYLDNSATDLGPAAVASATLTNQILSIGGYSDVISVNHSLEHEWRLGKWSFHDHVLSAGERSTLFSAM